MNDMPLAAPLSIREVGLDEYWLQKYIYDNPSCLGLGDLEPLSIERRQNSGGRLDILLKDPEDDAMFEVEIMLGETDETHIIRTIEYWDNEKRRWPMRQHFAVLVAEQINRRFFNVIHLLSYSIPIIAIQASLLEANGNRFISFTTVLDTYEEVDDGTSLEAQSYSPEYWSKKSPWTLESAGALLALSKEFIPDVELVYNKHYIAISGKKNYIWLYQRSQGKSLVGFRIADTQWEKVTQLLDEANIIPNRKKGAFQIVMDKQLISTHAHALKQIVELVRDS